MDTFISFMKFIFKHTFSASLKTIHWIHPYGYIHMDTFISCIQFLFKYAFSASLKTIHWIHSDGYIHMDRFISFMKFIFKHAFSASLKTIHHTQTTWTHASHQSNASLNTYSHRTHNTRPVPLEIPKATINTRYGNTHVVLTVPL